MRKRVAIVVEGETERDFVRHILQHEITEIDIAAINLGGGNISVGRLHESIKPLLPSKFACISTFVDLYRFAGSDGGSAEGIEDALRDKVRPMKQKGTEFLPYIQKHEFEALVLAGKEVVADYLNLQSAQRKQLDAITAPEEINHKLPPSKFLIDIYPPYNKRIDGINIIRKIGLAKIARECPRFGGWLGELRRIAG